jgi:mRNA-degrading endonuclease RelE of RelBE toxin-antitoxin system
MNKLDKFLSKLDSKNRLILEKVISLIVINEFSTLDLKKLKGSSDKYRVRIGKIRIIFERTKTGNNIQNISYRDDNTY